MNYEQKVNSIMDGTVDRFEKNRRDSLKIDLDVLKEKNKDLLTRIEFKTKIAKEYINTQEMDKSRKCLDEIDEMVEEYEKNKFDRTAIKEMLEGSSSLGIGDIQTFDHVVYPTPFSIGDYCGRMLTDSNRTRITADSFDDTDCSDLVSEGESGVTKDLYNYIQSFDSNAQKLMDLLEIDNGVFDDDEQAILTAMDSVHSRHNINAENKKVFELLLQDKEPIELDVVNINKAINENIKSDLKYNTEIWVNNNGFNKLDVDINGNNLIKKNKENEFIYKEKYIVREFDQNILPTDPEKGTPVLIGVFKNILKFIETNPTLLNSQYVRFDIDVTSDRYIKKITPVLLDKSNKAYILCYLKDKQ